jgi:hypothetical protein
MVAGEAAGDLPAETGFGAAGGIKGEGGDEQAPAGRG